MSKKIIIVFGVSGVGKSYYCEQFIKDNPQYNLLPATYPFEKIQQYEYVIMDYYFNNDYNANKLRQQINCPVEIRVLLDRPEEIAKRQILHKNNQDNVNCFTSINLYEKHLRELVNITDCYFYYQGNHVTYERYLELCHEFRKPYSVEDINKHIEWIKSQSGYDWQYHTIELPHGITIHKEGYSYNKQSWEVIKPLYNWKHKTILDLGCFHGYYCQEIYKLGGNPIGVEIHPQALYSACIFAKIKNMDFQLMKIDLNEHFPKQYADVALCLSMFHHVKNQELFLQNLSKVSNVIFEINSEDKSKITNYFNILTEIKSPKVNRIICLTTAK